jgi:hypothetical protein
MVWIGADVCVVGVQEILENGVIKEATKGRVGIK